MIKGSDRYAGIKPRHHQIILSDHAWQRWQECSGVRLTRRKLVRLLTVKLNGTLAVGLELDHTGAGWLEVTPWLWATVRLTDAGWMAMTFISWDESDAGYVNDAHFIAEARTGWPEAIQRALAAEAEAGRLRKALKFYANPDTHIGHLVGTCGVHVPGELSLYCPIEDDAGERARVALEDGSTDD